jgi:hypothetical protein
VRGATVDEIIQLYPLCSSMGCSRACVFDPEKPRFRIDAQFGRRISVHAHLSRRAPLPFPLKIDPLVAGLLGCPWELFTLPYHPCLKNMFVMLGSLRHFECKKCRGKCRIIAPLYR